MTFLLGKELEGGCLSRKICKLAEKVLKVLAAQLIDYQI